MEIGKQEVLESLQRFDLMHTGCNANGLMDREYADEAQRIARLVSDGRPLREAITVTFDEHFWSGCLTEPERSQELERLLRALGQNIGH
ncbi:MAG: hypothetical protein JWQ88_1330 [Rhodoferax sp.]|nr:hypothetical protein [Rhodoferax sp.]